MSEDKIDLALLEKHKGEVYADVDTHELVALIRAVRAAREYLDVSVSIESQDAEDRLIAALASFTDSTE